MIRNIVRYPGTARDYRAHVVRPQVSYTSPGVVLLHDRWGVTPEMEGFAAKLAHAGFVVMLPDLYDGRRPGDDGEARQWMHRLSMEEGREEVRLALAWLRNQAYTTAHRTAVIGFEHFGLFALLGGTLSRFTPQAVVVFCTPVGQVVTQVNQLKTAVQGHFAARDKYVPQGDVDAFRTALAQAGVVHEIHVYPDVRHDFMRPDSKHYVHEVAEQAWERTIAFLKRQLEGQ